MIQIELKWQYFYLRKNVLELFRPCLWDSRARHEKASILGDYFEVILCLLLVFLCLFAVVLYLFVSFLHLFAVALLLFVVVLCFVAVVLSLCCHLCISFLISLFSVRLWSFFVSFWTLHILAVWLSCGHFASFCLCFVYNFMSLCSQSMFLPVSFLAFFESLSRLFCLFAFILHVSTAVLSFCSCSLWSFASFCGCLTFVCAHFVALCSQCVSPSGLFPLLCSSFESIFF